jgi:N utilization substance protein B
MGKRRDGREIAVQFLFQRDLNSKDAAEDAELFWELRPATPKARTFAQSLVEGVIAHQQEIDERIKRYCSNYDLHRLAAVDRNILRLGLYEMFFCNDIPPVVSINEAIEVAKKFGGEESARFINGVLDRAKLDLTRPERTASS